MIIVEMGKEKRHRMLVAIGWEGHKAGNISVNTDFRFSEAKGGGNAIRNE